MKDCYCTITIIGYRIYHYLLQVLWFKLLFLSDYLICRHSLAMALSDIGGDCDAEGSKTMQEKGTKRQNQDVLYQWELLPVRALQPGKRSRLEAATTYEQLYTWMAEAPTKKCLYRSELCSTKAVYRGVGLSRFAQCWQAVCEAYVAGTDGMKACLQTGTYKTNVDESSCLLPHLKVLNGAGLPSTIDKAAGRAMLGKAKNEELWKDPDDVKKAVAYVLDWASKPSPLRKVTQAMNMGSLNYCCYAEWMAVAAYLKVGSGKDRASVEVDAVARLCQGKGVEGAGTAIGDCL